LKKEGMRWNANGMRKITATKSAEEGKKMMAGDRVFRRVLKPPAAFIKGLTHG
jgi:hypothetical protein